MDLVGRLIVGCFLAAFSAIKLIDAYFNGFARVPLRGRTFEWDREKTPWMFYYAVVLQFLMGAIGCWIAVDAALSELRISN